MDIDTDIEDSGREAVKEYCRFKYGRQYCANIITFGTAAAKDSIKTVNRCLGGSVAKGNELADLVPETPGVKLKDCLTNQKFRTVYDTDEYAKKVIDLALKIEGLSKNVGVHASGFIIADKPIVEYMPEVMIKNTKTGNYEWATAMDGVTCEELGLLKMDFLGLRTLGYVHETIDNIKKNTGEDIAYDEIPINDIEVYKWLADGNTESVFQAESDLFTSVIKKSFQDLTAGKEISGDEGFERIVAANALVRPGSNAFIDDYARNILNPDGINYDIKELAPILNDTYGIILYQEQTMRICGTLAGFSQGQQDTIRKGMAKKHKEILDEYKEYFATGSEALGIKGCQANGIDADKARAEWDVMALASSYSFNKSHAVAYSLHTVRTAWLAMKYPYEYMTAVLNSYLGNADDIARYLTVAKKKGLTISAPNLNKSSLKFTTDGNSIYVGLGSIKGVASGAETIIAERENGDFISLEDFLKRMSQIPGFSIGRVCEALIYSGVFDVFGFTRLDLINQLTKITDFVKKYKTYRERLVDGKKHRVLVEPTLELEKTDKEFTHSVMCLKEKQYSGMYISGNPLDEYADIIKKNRKAYAGVLEDYKEKISRKGTSFYSLTFVIGDETISGVLFQDKLPVEKGEPVLIEGRMKEDDFGKNITVNNILSLKEIREAEQYLNDDIILYVEPDTVSSKELLEVLADAPEGKRTVYVNYLGKEFKLKEKIYLTVPLYKELKNRVSSIEIRRP